MKKTVSFNLEEDIIEKIEQYKKDNNLSSRSSALERMILLQGNSNMDINLIKSLLKDLVSEVNNNEVVNKPVVEEKISIISNSIANVFDTIKD